MDLLCSVDGLLMRVEYLMCIYILARYVPHGSLIKKVFKSKFQFGGIILNAFIKNLDDHLQRHNYRIVDHEVGSGTNLKYIFC